LKAQRCASSVSASVPSTSRIKARNFMMIACAPAEASPW
jgi:hypothetical protein